MFEEANEIPPEFASVETFGEFLLDEDRTEFTYEEAVLIAKNLKHSVATLVIRDLKSYGFTMTERGIPKRVRGFTTSSHDRYYGPGSSKMHGGSGHEQISGFAGQKG